eukprot:TRINITY_DN16248_c0_g2_i1.p1 TRINITY_DN16248_c0_g2~~TRINITY_DN16248_c0_g2_i1.p1  ORF type:complete len:407 (+),score=72.83 TRINITY_DN16248_c0_g2_i1:252-1472(+)
MLKRCSIRHMIRWANTNFDVSKEYQTADEDVDHVLSVKQKHKLKLVTQVVGEDGSRAAWQRHAMTRETPLHNHNEAQVYEQIKKNDPSINVIEVLDTGVPDGVKGLWVYPFFLSPDEQRSLESETAPFFRNPDTSSRVKNTCTLMRNAHRDSDNPNWDSLRHGWRDRNHPSITHIGRRNVFHTCKKNCEARKKNFVDFTSTPEVSKLGDKIWEYFGPDSVQPKKQNSKWGSGEVQEWQPQLDRRPNLARGSEWLEATTGMNAHVKNKNFGNYVCIVNLHSTGVLHLCHPHGDSEVAVDEENPEGGTRVTKVVLHPGSLVVLKYDARWSIPTGYSYETQNIFRLNSWPKDYRTSLMFCHYSSSRPGNPAIKNARQTPTKKQGREKTMDPAYAGRRKQATTEVQVPMI